jgi:hypothetical protein
MVVAKDAEDENDGVKKALFAMAICKRVIRT